MKPGFITSILLLFFTAASAQLPIKGRSHLVSLTGHLPLAAFQHSHTAGAGLAYSWSPGRFGKAVANKKISLLAMGGADLFFGKQIETAGHHFRYSPYSHFYLMAGPLYETAPGLQLSVLGGPAMGLYKGNTELGATALLQVNYFFQQRYAIAPALQWRKDKNEEALWSLSIRASYAF
ncbi:MAG: hypothetical protein QM781_02550 [Chitinophagaceae bacterium]